jgi:succinate dehydrogenase flavin-adding protein (antitoxin of CptAB toxin-antitoxin module)
MKSVDELSQAAQIAYRAFIDMSDSKTAHFTLLESIDVARKAGEPPSIAESRELEKLLAAHDRNVLAYRTAMAEVTDEDEMQALVRLMS